MLGLRDAVLDVAVTTDRGYCLSIRGLAREAAAALDVPFRDIDVDAAGDRRRRYEVTIDDPAGCDRFSARAIERSRPDGAVAGRGWRSGCGSAACASISLAVDVTNYVMLETGQPLHAFDRAKLTGADRRAPRACRASG